MAKRFKPTLSAILSLLILGMALSSCGDFGFTVHVLYGENGRGDRGLNDISFLGVLEGRDALDATVVQWTPLDQDEAGYLLTSVLAEPLRSPDELIILVGEIYEGLVSQVECQFRDRRVLHIEGTDSGCTKVLSVDFLTYAPSYMAGVAAATASVTGKVAVIGGGLTNDVKESAAGFIEGAKSVGAIATASYFSPSQNGFNNYDEGLLIGEKLFGEDGVDVIFVAAGATGLGVLEAAKRADNRYIVGFDFDLVDSGQDVVLGSVVKQVNSTILEAMRSVKEGGFEPGYRTTGLADENVVFNLNPGFSALVGSEYLDVREDALAKEVTYRGSL